MAEQRKNKVDFSELAWQGQVFAPLAGEVGKLIVTPDKFLRSQLGKTLWYNEQTAAYEGSNFPIAARVDSIARELSSGAVRVVTLQDTQHPTLKDMIRSKHYVDTNALVIQTPDDEIEENVPIIEQVKQIASDRKVSFELPCRVTGLDVALVEGSRGYSWKVLGREDFVVVQNEALNYKQNGMRFTEMQDGFPIEDKNGAYQWFLRNNGSASCYRDSDLNARASNGNGGGSNRCGRVVLTADGVGAPEILRSFVRRLQEKYKAQYAELEQRYASAEKILSGKE